MDIEKSSREKKDGPGLISSPTFRPTSAHVSVIPDKVRDPGRAQVLMKRKGKTSHFTRNDTVVAGGG
jgi:hypothetical protein